MSEQTTLLDEPNLPEAMIDFLAGFATYYAFGEKPSAAEKRQGRAVAEKIAPEIAGLRS